MVLGVYQRGVGAALGIAHVERFVMEDLFWSDTPMLQTLHPAEGLAPELQVRAIVIILK